MEKIDIKGLQAVRRDNTLFVRETCKEILDVILESNNPIGAIDLAKRKAVDLLDGRVRRTLGEVDESTPQLIEE